jgi:hypothetical protein
LAAILFHKAGKAVGKKIIKLKEPKSGGGGGKSGGSSETVGSKTGTEFEKPVEVEQPKENNISNSSSKPKKAKLKSGTPEHKQARWEEYQNRGGKWDYNKWSKQYDTNMKNAKFGLEQEQRYREKFGGESETIKTEYSNRQIDIYKPDEMYMGQLKTGKMSLTEQAKIDIQKDAWLVKEGNTVEYILEKGASKNFIKALEEANIKYKIGKQIP